MTTNDGTAPGAARLLTNGTIHSTAEPYAEAMLVEDGQVAWLGSDETAARLREQREPGTIQEEDLDRALVAPGFVGWITRGIAEGDPGDLAERLDAVAALGYSAVRLGLAVPADRLAGESVQMLASGLTSSFRTAAGHPLDTYPVVQLSGLQDVAGASGLKALNELLSLLGENEDIQEAAGRPIAVAVSYAEVEENLIGVRTWMSEESRQLILDVSEADPADVVDAIVGTHSQLRELRWTPKPDTPTVLVGFDSPHREHWEQLLNTGIHVLARRPIHLATALSVGVPTCAAPPEGESPWQLISDHVHHGTDPASVRAGFTAQTRGAYRSLVGGQPESGLLNPASAATYVVWEVESLAVQTPNATVSAWSTDTRARTPLLPYLPEPGAEEGSLPRWKETVIHGEPVS
ncbi:hypothetical protein [Nesterenkonia populi]